MQCPCGAIIPGELAYCLCGLRRPHAWRCVCGQEMPWSHETALVCSTVCLACGKEKPETPGLKLPAGPPLEGASYIQLLAARFQCPKCQKRGGSARRLSEGRRHSHELVDLAIDLIDALIPSGLVAISCTGCGFTELYNPDVINQ